MIKNRKINVAHLIGSLSIGGAQVQTVQLLNYLDPNIFKKYLLVFWHKPEGLSKLKKSVKYKPLNFRLRLLPISLIKLSKYLKFSRIDILHTHMYAPNMYGVLAGKLAGVKVIITGERGRNPWKRWHHHIVERFLISRFASMRVAVSNDIRQLRIDVDGVPPHKIVTIPNGVELNGYVADTSFRPKTIGCLGRLVEAKDYPTLFLAVKILKDCGYNLQVRIAGDGHLKDELEKLVKKLDLTSDINFIGFQKPIELLMKSNIFALPSIREGMPGALMEAMSCGLPVVATRAGGIPELVTHSLNGLLSTPGDPHELAVNIRTLVEDESLRTKISKNARRMIINFFTMEKTAERYSQLYHSLLFPEKKIYNEFSHKRY
jgi:glycosyltransferase involved in cell wall biosynthesis